MYRSVRTRPLTGRENPMRKHCNVSTASHSPIQSNWKNGRNFKKKPLNVIIVKSDVNKNCSFSTSYRPVRASFCRVAHLSTIRWWISSSQSIASAASTKWFRQTFTTQSCGKHPAIGNIMPRICFHLKLKRRNSHWNQWTVRVIVWFLIIEIVHGVSCHFDWPISVFFIAMNCRERSVDWLVYVFWFFSFFILICLFLSYKKRKHIHSTQRINELKICYNFCRFVVSNKTMHISSVHPNKFEVKLMVL